MNKDSQLKVHVWGISKRIHMEALYPEICLSNGTQTSRQYMWTAVSCTRYPRQLNCSSPINKRGEKHTNNKSFVFTDARTTFNKYIFG